MVVFALNFEDEISRVVDHLLDRHNNISGVLDLVSEINSVCVSLHPFDVLLSNLNSVVQRVPCDNLRWFATMRLEYSYLVEFSIIRFDFEVVFSTIGGVASLSRVDMERKVRLP